MDKSRKNAGQLRWATASFMAATNSPRRAVTDAVLGAARGSFHWRLTNHNLASAFSPRVPGAAPGGLFRHGVSRHAAAGRTFVRAAAKLLIAASLLWLSRLS